MSKVASRHASAKSGAATTLGGCYHATVNTGITPGTRQVEDEWAAGWIAGLVPPETVNAMADCGRAGVARVETRQSFLNGLVSVLTIGIFTPMEISVTCGAGSTDEVQGVASAEELEEALKSGEPFFVELGGSAEVP